MFRNGKSVVGLVILAFFGVLAIVGPWIAPYDPNAIDLEARNSPPSPTHWLGTTHLGQDILSQIIIGSRDVMFVGFAAGVIGTLIAVLVGVTSGYLKGFGSEALSALSNVFLVIPGLPLIIIITSNFDDPSMLLIAVVLAITGWAWGARVLRAQTMSLRNRDFVQAARANGEPLWRIIGVEMLPNLMAIIASSFVGTVTAAILTQTTLAFVGVTPITRWNWGTILFWAQSQNAFPERWWWYLPAGLCIALVGTGLALVNFGIDEYVNPRLRSAGKRARALRRKGFTQADATVVAPLGAVPPSAGEDAADAREDDAPRVGTGA
ncbi:ABC transporter permease [Protaetiibacter sp. 10F1B-8-1]|uniref:ABC transporter permease n=2 Tax=Protaetiibacter mangrovi TaxID=2970926 RepID=A0ABT1ZIX4_9MICO|nr:ABC transporter permease [Protaetiibacter mangrovi]MCS0500668.1 ABC transporter permease [Protaetiibacter mangrovi]